jgi:membrane fusion protein, copper/silver efflux system
MITKAIYSTALCALVGAAFLAGSLHNSRDAVAAAAVETRTPLYYRCPMHPTYTSDKPGTAPCCGMKLEPVYASGGSAATASSDAHHLPGAIVVSVEQQHTIGTRVSAVETAGGTEQLRLYGKVAPEESRVYKVNVGLDGAVRDVAAVTTGSQIRKDQLLVTFSTPEARQPFGSYVTSLDLLDRETRAGTPTQVAAAATTRQSMVDRLLTLGVSPVQIEEMARTRAVPTHIMVTSPIDGFVVARNVSAGEKFEKNAELFRIADLRRVWIFANVAADDVEQVRPGTIGRVVVAGRATPIRARVDSRVIPQFDPATQSMKIRLEADNPDFVLRPDMFVDVHLELPYEATLTVPREAIVGSGLRNSVFVERTAGVFEPRDVKTGRRLGDRVEIVDGLTAGERIVVSGTFLLDSDSRMRVR